MDITSLAQLWIERFLGEGDLAIDATAGNGHDTVFLARRVGASGKVVGFDVQASALDATRKRLEAEGLMHRVRLLHRSHVEMAEALADVGENRQPRAILFNLGYLPGGDKSITTRADQTLAAAVAAVELVAPGGVVALVVYPGHSEGEREAGAILQWARELTGPLEVALCRPLNRSGEAPFLITVEKLKESGAGS